MMSRDLWETGTAHKFKYRIKEEHQIKIILYRNKA